MNEIEANNLIKTITVYMCESCSIDCPVNRIRHKNDWTGDKEGDETRVPIYSEDLLPFCMRGQGEGKRKLSQLKKDCLEEAPGESQILEATINRMLANGNNS